jgi:hypothetical protein
MKNEREIIDLIGAEYGENMSVVVSFCFRFLSAIDIKRCQI